MDFSWAKLLRHGFDPSLESCNSEFNMYLEQCQLSGHLLSASVCARGKFLPLGTLIMFVILYTFQKSRIVHFFKDSVGDVWR